MKNMSFPIQINAIALNHSNFLLRGLTEKLLTNSVQTMQLEHGSYRLLTHGTADTTWQFNITSEGLVDYQPSLDVTQGGFLSDRGTTNPYTDWFISHSGATGTDRRSLSSSRRHRLVSPHRAAYTTTSPRKLLHRAKQCPSH
jgi:hypothetical protein